MNTDYFKDIYKDFFGVETLPKEENKEIKEGSQNTMITLFDKINKLYIKDESKELLKKIQYLEIGAYVPIFVIRLERKLFFIILPNDFSCIT